MGSRNTEIVWLSGFVYIVWCGSSIHIFKFTELGETCVMICFKRCVSAIGAVARVERQWWFNGLQVVRYGWNHDLLSVVVRPVVLYDHVVSIVLEVLGLNLCMWSPASHENVDGAGWPIQLFDCVCKLVWSWNFRCNTQRLCSGVCPCRLHHPCGLGWRRQYSGWVCRTKVHSPIGAGCICGLRFGSEYTYVFPCGIFVFVSKTLTQNGPNSFMLVDQGNVCAHWHKRYGTRHRVLVPEVTFSIDLFSYGACLNIYNTGPANRF